LSFALYFHIFNLTILRKMAPVYFLDEKDPSTRWLSQWYHAPFTAPSPVATNPHMTFVTCEQYMMYHKAFLFGDTETASKIMETESPEEQKALGRKAKGFNNAIWGDNRERIVEEGNWNKFANSLAEPGLKQLLLDTGDRELVEVGSRLRCPAT
jgi:ribA/ribD-fused uncharacterized protein